MPVRATKRGAERTPFPSGASYDVVICGASFAGLAVARELRAIARAGPGARSLRDRGEADVRVLRTDRVDHEPRARVLDPPDVRLDGHAHHGRERALVDPVHVLDVRLPRAVRADVGAVRRRRVRDRQGRWPHRARDPHRPRRRARRADRRRARLAAGARQRDDPAARGDALARPGGPSERLRPRPAAVGRPALRAVGLRLVVPRAATSCGSASAPTTRASTSRSRPCGSPRTRAPTPSATRATGSPTASATPSRTACSSAATPPGTASR